MPNPAQSSGQALLMPNRAPSTRNTQTVLVEVNSRDRNYNNQIGTNPLRFLFARPLKDVRGLELLAGTVPARPWPVSASNGRFTFQEGTGAAAQRWTVTIPPSFYTDSTLAAALQLALNTLPGAFQTYTVTQTSDGFCRIASAGGLSFSLLFASGYPTDEIDRSDGCLIAQNTPAGLLGFDCADYSDAGAGAILSPYRMAVATTRLYLYVNFDNGQSLSAIERGAGRRAPFAIVYLDSETNGYKFLNKDTLTPASYSLPQPLARLQALQIEFRDEFYRLVDFGGAEWSLLFQLTLLE